ncbi:Vacuolar protein-sorting-associated protein 36 [Rhodosporidiobolus nylandii]
MHRFTPLALPSPSALSALLYPDEHIVQQQPDVGLYNGKDKSPAHQLGTLALTTHRLLYLSHAAPHRHSLALPLSSIRQTEFWGGFLKSSPKITLTLSGSGGEDGAEGGGTAREDGGAQHEPEELHRKLAQEAQGREWICRVCGMKNAPSPRCSLCGVPADSSSSSAPPSTAPSRFSTPPPPPRPPVSAPPPPPSPAVDPHEAGARLACPVCTFLNHHSMTSCEMCGSSLFPPSAASSSSLPSSLPSSTAPTPRPSTPAPAAGGDKPEFVRLSFRKGGAGGFYTKLKEELAARRWEVRGVEKKSTGPAKGKGKEGEAGEEEGKGGGGGIDAILRTLDLSAQEREDEMDVALADLESLMKRAGEMIALARSLSTQSTQSSALSPSASPSPSSSEAAQLATRSLSQLGLLSAPAVTAAEARSQEEYHRQLAGELRDVVRKSGLLGSFDTEGEGDEERGRGIVGLDEVWSLVSPRDLRLALSHLPALPPSPSAPPLRTRTFPSGLTILHTPRFSLPSFSARVLEALDVRQAVAASLEELPSDAEEAAEREGLTLLDLARLEGLSVGLVKELVELVELGDGASGRGGGEIVRDEQGGEGASAQRITKTLSRSTRDIHPLPRHYANRARSCASPPAFLSSPSSTSNEQCIKN